MTSGPVAIIPARGGSKRIPNKNVRPFAGVPMIAHSIRAAQQSGIFERIIVSTDSDAIVEVAKSYGAEVPFRRPDALSNDHAGTAPVLEHALAWLNEQGALPAYACCIYATAPFVRPVDLNSGFETLQSTGASTVFSITTFAFPIFRALQLSEEGEISMFWPENRLKRSQDLPEAYHDAGQFYWLNVAKFMADPSLYNKDSRPVILPRYLVQDIDTLEDWETAEYMHEALVNSRRGQA